MSKSFMRAAVCVAGLAGFALTAVAQNKPMAAAQFTAGAIVVTAPWTREPPSGARVAGGFMQVTNTGTTPDRLLGGNVTFAGRFEIHEMAMDGTVMKMRELPGGLEIKPGATVELKPGGYHIMFMDLKEPLKSGSTAKGRLTFEKAGEVEVEFVIAAPGSRAAGAHAH